MSLPAPISMTLVFAQSSQAHDERMTALGVGFVLALGAFLWMVYSNRQNRIRADELFKELQRRGTPSQHLAERDNKAFEQHVALNDLTAEKLKLESQYLQMQVKIQGLEVESRERAEEYHRLMTEKTRFEIQSLKLHIREQNKRLDDYTGFNEDE